MFAKAKFFLQGFKYKLAQLIRMLPLSSEIVGPPREMCNSSLNWALTFETNKGSIQNCYFEIPYESKYCEKVPKGIEETIHWKFVREMSFRVSDDPLFIVSIPDGRTWHSSAVITSDDRVLGDLSADFVTSMPSNYEHKIFSKLRLGSLRSIEGTALLLATFGADSNYFHWMLDLLPRLGLFRNSNFSSNRIDNIIVNNCKLRFQRETLDILKIPPDTIIETNELPYLKAQCLIVPSLIRSVSRSLRRGSLFSRFSYDFLRNSFLTDSTLSRVSSDLKADKIYISRSMASHRRVLNEVELIAFLLSHGFKIIELESLAFAEQVFLFNNATLIVSPHGAGLTNVVFCKQGATLVELFSPNYVHPCFWHICNQIGVDYFYLIGQGKRPEDYVEKSVTLPYRDNIQVDINDLSRILDMVI